MEKYFILTILTIIIYQIRYSTKSINNYETETIKKRLKIWFPIWLFYGFELVIWFILLSSVNYLLSTKVHQQLLIALSITGIIVPFIYLYLIKDYDLRQRWTIDTVKNINEYGFEIHTYKNGHLKKNTLIRWESISRIKVTYNLDILLNTGEWINLDTKTEHYHYLLKSLQNYLPNISKSQIKKKFSRLKPCPICGSIAVDYKHCEACGTAIWKSEFKRNYDNPMNYVRAKQLDLFASLHKNSIQKIAFSSNDTFELDKNWQPIITQAEIINQSKKLFWVL